ncbi:patatin-like phospholipase family protein [Methylobacterium sp. A52T]
MGTNRLPLAADARIALALSGGGSRAAAFHLGTLRALRATGLLDRVATISAVSGGSVLAALYCSCPGDFDAFEGKVYRALARGFVTPALLKAVTTAEGLKAAANAVPIAVDRLAAFAVRQTFGRIAPRRVARIGWLAESPVIRRASRTTILQRVFSDLLDGAMLTELRSDRPKLIVVACELRTKSAFYFAKDGMSTWHLGVADPASVEVAEAVAASAAYPAFLPALDKVMTFEKQGASAPMRVILTDGGVYDNLGLAPFWPDRDPAISRHVEQHDLVVASRAGYALHQSPAASLWPSRMRAVVDGIHARAQNLAVSRAFDLQRAGCWRFILPYLDQNDAALACPPSDLIGRDRVKDYPTDFSPMPEEMIRLLSGRGEQLTKALIDEHLSGDAGTAGNGRPAAAGFVSPSTGSAMERI